MVNSNDSAINHHAAHDDERPATEERTSAIRDSVARKGNNSYYYAWDKLDLSREAEFRPRLVRTDTVPVDDAKPATPINKYAWSDEGATVKIYVDVVNVGKLPSENVKSEFDARSFSVKITDAGGDDARLYISGLDGEIIPDKCRTRIQTNMVIVVLAKHNPDHKWHSLCKK
uniref:CS domain-containing protein n=1 Tax=Spongospora subterranea TaxID=70186 RepID=A0A0H5R5M8_9EUKA|eukprot:CRZ09438.1 hypothetical protein [Spongospora subterranea]